MVYEGYPNIPINSIKVYEQKHNLPERKIGWIANQLEA